MLRPYKTLIWIAAIVALLALMIAKSGKEDRQNIIKVGTSADYPPFEYYKNAELVGFDVDLINHIAKKLGYKTEWHQFSFDNLVGAMENKAVDLVVSGITATDKRRQRVAFSAVYYTPSFAIIHRADHPISSTKDMLGNKIGVQTGSTMEMFLKDFIAIHDHGNTKILSISDYNILIEELKLGRINGVLIEDLQADAYIKANPKLACHQLGSEGEGYAIAFAENSPLVAQVDQVLAEMKESGELAALKKQWGINQK